MRSDKVSSEEARNIKIKEEIKMIAFTQNSDKETDEEESNLLLKTLQKMKFKDYQQEKVEKKVTKNLNRKILQQRSSKEGEQKSIPFTINSRGKNQDLLMQTLLSNENSSNNNKQPSISFRSIIRSRNFKDVNANQANDEVETTKKQSNNNISNFHVEKKLSSNLKGNTVVNGFNNEDNGAQKANSTVHELKKSKFVQNLSKNKGFRRTIFKNTINKMIEQVVDYEQEKEKLNEQKNDEEDDFFKFVMKKKEIKHGIAKIDKALSFNKLINQKIEREEFLDTLRRNHQSVIKRQKDKNQFNFKNLDNLTKQIREFKKVERDKQKEILSKAFNSDNRMKFTELPMKRTRRRMENKLLENIILNDKIQKKKTYDFFNQKKFVLMNYNGYSLYCPVIKKENISNAISVNELYDLIFQH